MRVANTAMWAIPTHDVQKLIKFMVVTLLFGSISGKGLDVQLAGGQDRRVSHADAGPCQAGPPSAARTPLYCHERHRPKVKSRSM